MHVMFGLLHALAGQHAFALLVDLEHMKLGLLPRPAENGPEYMRDVLHVIDRVNPANQQKAGLQARLWLVLGLLHGAREYVRRSGLHHNRKVKYGRRVVEQGGEAYGVPALAGGVVVMEVARNISRGGSKPRLTG